VAKAVTEATGQQLLTSTGVALGTPMYMAPEQAMADPHQDHRVDIYALGLLGYELLTGRAPFSATTAQEMLAAHVTAVPDPVEKYRAAVSPALAAVVMKCLAKKPADRWQTAEEVLQHLEPLATPSGGTTPTQTAPVEAVRARRRFLVVAGGAGLIAFAAVAAVAYQLLKPKPLNITLEDIRPVTSEPGVEFQPAISPDGREVAYVAGPISLPRLFVKSAVTTAGGSAVRLGDIPGGSEWYPQWTSDGEFVRFLGCRGALDGDCGQGLSEVGRLGGVARAVTVPLRAEGVRWSPDGSRVAFARRDTIFTAERGDSAVRLVAVHKAGYWVLHSPLWSPDGKLIAYVNGNAEWLTSGNVAASSIWLVDAGGGVPVEVAGAGFLNVSPAWFDARHLMFISNRDGPRAVYIVEVGANGPRGTPRAVPGIADPHSITYSGRSRRLAFAKLTLRQNIRAYPLDRSRPISIRDGRLVTTGNQVIESHSVSPDGRWIAYDGNVRGNMDLYKIPVAGGEVVQLTDSPDNESTPFWSPDGREIAFTASSSVSPADTRVMIVASGGGTPVTLTDSPGWDNLVGWAPSGLGLLFYSERFARAGQWFLPRDSVGGGWHEAVPYSPCPAGWAPKDRSVLRVAGNSVRSCSHDGRTEWQRHVPATRGLTSRSASRFSRDGQTVYAMAKHQDGRLGIWRIPLLGGEARLVVAFDDPALVPFTLYGGGLSVGPDQLYLTVSEYESDIWVANLRW
jgi:Tol biopolymer transport system component